MVPLHGTCLLEVGPTLAKAARNSGGLFLLVGLEGGPLRQLGDVCCKPPRLVFSEQLVSFRPLRTMGCVASLRFGSFASHVTFFRNLIC
jgi:hypothetical protein